MRKVCPSRSLRYQSQRLSAFSALCNPSTRYSLYHRCNTRFGCAVFVKHDNSGDAEICHEFFESFDGAIVEIHNVTAYFLRLVDYPEKALCKVGRSYFFIADTLTSDIFYCAVGYVFAFVVLIYEKRRNPCRQNYSDDGYNKDRLAKVLFVL